MKWDEAMIRKEIERLDKLTGLSGRKLPIVFNDARHTLGSFYMKNGVSSMFKFSRVFFDDERFSEHEAYDTIRHEYAHYMNHELNGEREDGSHGKMWKACCRVVGARPRARYDAHENDMHLQREQEKAREQQQIHAFLDSLTLGGELRHPRFGLGRICAIDRQAKDARLELAFSSGERKTISAKWMAEQCGRRTV